MAKKQRWIHFLRFVFVQDVKKESESFGENLSCEDCRKSEDPRFVD